MCGGASWQGCLWNFQEFCKLVFKKGSLLKSNLHTYKSIIYIKTQSSKYSKLTAFHFTMTFSYFFFEVIYVWSVCKRWKYYILLWCALCFHYCLLDNVRLVAWNWPWKEYLHHNSWQMLASKALEKEMTIHSSILAWRITWATSLSGYSPWGRKESDMTEQLNMHACQAWCCFVDLKNIRNEDYKVAFILWKV